MEALKHKYVDLVDTVNNFWAANFTYKELLNEEPREDHDQAFLL